MKKNKLLILIITIFLISFSNKESFAAINATTNNSGLTIISNLNNISRGNMFNFFADYYNGKVPNSYRYIKVNFKDVEKGSILERSLQKLIYLNLIDNPNRNLDEDGELSAWGFYRLSEKVLGINIIDKETKEQLLSRKATFIDKAIVKQFIGDTSIDINTLSTSREVKQKKAILNDVYKTLVNGHYDKKELEEINILNKAIEGITKGVEDKHTVYFPPIKSKTFHDKLSGEYEGIGSYVDMEQPGVLRITSPIPDSPSEKAGLKGGDIVIKVDGKEITEDNSLNEVITWIKGPAGSDVILTVKRGNQTLDITVTREKIVVTDIETERLDVNTYYIQIKSFGENVSEDFEKSIDVLNNEKNITKIIIDLRNNGGGYLSEVTEILSHFVPKGEKTAIVKYLKTNKEYISKGYNEIDFSKYKIVILQNSGTASASEILIGTLNDYYKDLITVGEQSYGKGSVQVMKNYSDGSLLKYTIARWFTGGTETGIDGIGITPTELLEFDYDKYKTYEVDNQLEKAKFIK